MRLVHLSSLVDRAGQALADFLDLLALDQLLDRCIALVQAVGRTVVEAAPVDKGWA